MKKICFSCFLIFFFIQNIFAQERVEAPVWNIGDKWGFNEGTVEVVGVDENSYAVKLLGLTLMSEETTLIFEKPTFKITQRLEGERRKKFEGARSRILNFPLSTGKTWKDNFSSKQRGQAIGEIETQFFERIKVLGWEEVVVKAGKFRAIKLEYKQQGIKGNWKWEGTAWYWYSPEVKYFVKCEYEKPREWIKFTNWELVSFDLKK